MNGATARACRCFASRCRSRVARAGPRPTCSISRTSRLGSLSEVEAADGLVAVVWGQAAHRRRSGRERRLGRGRRQPGGGGRRLSRASYVVGCDGANSTVRDAARASSFEDRGFYFDWLVVDVAAPRASGLRPAEPAGVRSRVGPRPSCPAGRAGGAGSSCACPGSPSRPSTRRRPRGRSSSRGTSARATPPWSATPATGSERAGRRGGTRAGSSLPGTPPTRRHPSPARGCAPASATPPTWPGSSTTRSDHPECSGASRDLRHRADAPRRGRHRGRHRARTR